MISVVLHFNLVSISSLTRLRTIGELPSLQEVGRDEREKERRGGDSRMDEAKCVTVSNTLLTVSAISEVVEQKLVIRVKGERGGTY